MGLFAITSVRPRRGRECSPLVPLGPDAGKASLVEEERELDRLGHRTYSTEAVLSPNKPYLLVRRRVVSIGGPCVHDFFISPTSIAFGQEETFEDL